METATMRAHSPDGRSDDRSTIDEALFADHPGYFPSHAPELPAEVVLSALHPAVDDLRGQAPPDQVVVETPAWLRYGPNAEPVEPRPCGAVRDGGVEYQMTGLAPGLFELRVVSEPPAPAEPGPAAADTGSEPCAEEAVFADPPFRAPCELAVNSGLRLGCGEEAVITPAELCLSGPAETDLIAILLLAPPAHGVLLRDGFALSPGDTFTQQDVDTGRLRYRHDGGGVRQDSFTFATADGEVQPALFVLTIEPSAAVPPPPLPQPATDPFVLLDLDAPAPPVAEALPEPPEEAPETVVEPPVPCALVANAGLGLMSGEEAVITPAELCLSGPAETDLIAILLLAPPAHGVLLRDGFALSPGDTFTQQDVDTGRLRYRHDGGAVRQDSFTFTTADGAVPPTVFRLAVEPSRTAPQLHGPGQLDGVLDGCRVADVLAGQARCHEPEQAAGLAVVAVAGRGQWYCSFDGMRTWQELGEVGPGQARLLGPDDGLRFVPRDGWSGTVKVRYHAWDGSVGQPGDVVDLEGDATSSATAFSAASAAAVLHLPPPAMAGVVDPCQDEPTLAELVGDGLAVVRLEGQGSWQYSLDDGRTWRPFGLVYHGRARLLRATDRVRFLPRRGAGGKVLIGGRPWDECGGSPGSTASVAARASHGDGTPFGEFVQTRTWWMREG
jgi:hypothetical protein